MRGKGTVPERQVRNRLERAGIRYKANTKGLPGTPDLVIPSVKRAVFVHGCFWHMHRCRYGRVVPKTNVEFWRAKRAANVRRDRRNLSALRRAGWRVMTLWECQIGDPLAVARNAKKFLEDART